MHMRFSIAALLAALVAVPAGAQTVKAGIDAWQRGDPGRAVAIWRPLAEAGDADAEFNLGQAFRLGRGTDRNLAAAQTWLERAARKDHLDAQTTLGLLLFQNGNAQGGLRWLKQAAERGEPRALLSYGTALFNGDGVSRDPVLGYAYVSRAAAQGLAPAQQTLAEMDRTLPASQRRKGVALALDKAKAPPQQSRRPRAEDAPQQPVKAVRAAPSGGGWNIQLGAFSKPAAAEALYKKLVTSAPVAGHQAHMFSFGSVTRLQVGPYPSKAEADAACAMLVARGQACFPVVAKK